MMKTPPRSYSYAASHPVYHKGQGLVNLTQGQHPCRFMHEYARSFLISRIIIHKQIDESRIMW